MANLLVDTGAVVAYLDQSEKLHPSCLAFLQGFQGRLLSTEAVLTESLYLLGDSFENQKKCFQFFIKGVQLIPTNSESLSRVLVLMEKYQDTPMDFADATLVALAEEIQTGEIFTLDRRGFETYRWGRNRPFKIHPEL